VGCSEAPRKQLGVQCLAQGHFDLQLMGRVGIELTTLRLQDGPLTPLSYSRPFMVNMGTVVYFMVNMGTVVYFMVNMGTVVYFMVNMGTVVYLMVNMGILVYFMVNMGTVVYFMVNMGTLVYFMINMGTLVYFMMNMGTIMQNLQRKLVPNTPNLLLFEGTIFSFRNIFSHLKNVCIRDPFLKMCVQKRTDGH